MGEERDSPLALWPGALHRFVQYDSTADEVAQLGGCNLEPLGSAQLIAR